jgi:hypothetical protein
VWIDDSSSSRRNARRKRPRAHHNQERQGDAKGLALRPLAETVKDTLAWWATVPLGTSRQAPLCHHTGNRSKSALGLENERLGTGLHRGSWQLDGYDVASLSLPAPQRGGVASRALARISGTGIGRDLARGHGALPGSPVRQRPSDAAHPGRSSMFHLASQGRRRRRRGRLEAGLLY